MQIEVKLPSSLREVKLKDYQELLIKENPDNDDMLKCILNINTKELGKIKNKDVENLLAIINKLFDKEHKFIPTFNLNNVLYGFIPNLDEITYGENKDITTYINNKDWGNMHKAMAVLFRPIKQKQGSKYLIEEYEGSHKYSETLKNMPLDVVLGAMVFFWNLTNALLNYIPSYLENQTKQAQTKGAVSIENGAVIQSYIFSARETLQSLNKLQSFPFTNA
tara:strand:+ start:1235 stop:1897 length:663 start_codon:yes stop_codon:yes gene_type:complete